MENEYFEFLVHEECYRPLFYFRSAKSEARYTVSNTVVMMSARRPNLTT